MKEVVTFESVDEMDVGQMLDEQGVQTVSTSFNIFKNKGNVESILNESSNQFKFDSTHFQQY